MTRFASLMTVALISASCGAGSRDPIEPEPNEPVLRVLTYNVNYGLAGDAETMAAIRDAGADVVILQETTPSWEVAIRETLSEDYPVMAFRHSRGAGGLAILSRFPLDEGELIDAPSGWFPAWRLVVEGPLGPVQLLAVHLRPPVSDRGSVVSGYFTTRPVRDEEITAYLGHLDPELPTIIAGDLNERNGRAIERLREAGFESALPAFQGSQHTWHWQTRVGQVTSQLDHVVHDNRLEPLNAEVLRTGRSDHYPVFVILRRSEDR